MFALVINKSSESSRNSVFIISVPQISAISLSEQLDPWAHIGTLNTRQTEYYKLYELTETISIKCIHFIAWYIDATTLRKYIFWN